VDRDAAQPSGEVIEDRLEHFFATTHERGQIHDAEIAIRARRPHPRRQGCLPARQTGAYDPYGLTVPDQQPVYLAGSLCGAGL